LRAPRAKNALRSSAGAKQGPSRPQGTRAQGAIERDRSEVQYDQIVKQMVNDDIAGIRCSIRAVRLALRPSA